MWRSGDPIAGGQLSAEDLGGAGEEAEAERRVGADLHPELALLR